MSGGFFRGTSADQDTRFSNKQAKLLKTQKFAPELENLVDMTKVKMDVMRPWIAHRVTELLGFEDEVLINFIYGLLEEKLVNGKEIQISLTGFMEKNTGKFMKELWTHLLSAQKNASGVPQQFLDAKEEETKKKQADADRILSELKRTKEKEGREHEQEKMKKMDGEVDNGKAAALESHSRTNMKVSSTWDEKEAKEKNGLKGRTRGTRSRSFSTSRSPSRSRSLSASPKPLKRSVSPERRHHSPSRRSFTPRRVGSPPRSRRRSPSPARRRFSSPVRRRSRSPLRRRPRSPMWRRSRSPLRRRSRSPIRRRSRSPFRRRSPSPLQYRSRSPVGRRSRSPLRRISESPMHSGSPSPVRRRSPSPVRRRYRRSPSPMRRRTTFPSRRRSPSPRSISSSPISRSPTRRRPPSPMGRRSPINQQRSPVQSPRNGPRILQKSSVRQAPRKENYEHSSEGRKKSTSSGHHLPPVSVRSPERDLNGRRISQIREPAVLSPPYNSPPRSRSPPATGRRSPSEDRSPVPPMRKRESMHNNDSLESVEVEEKRFSRGKEDKRQEKKEPVIDKYEKKKHSPAGLASHHSSEIRAQKKMSENDGRRRYPELADEPPSERARNSEKRTKADDTNDLRKNDLKHHLRNQESPKLPKIEKTDQRVSSDSGSDESAERRKRKRSKRKDVTSDDDDYSHDSDRKESKRRRKEEKRLKKEEKRKRREERRRRKDRRNEKRKLKAGGGNDSMSPEPEKNHGGGGGGYDSDGGPRVARAAGGGEVAAVSEQKKLEIELREKALESLRAKKGIGH